MLKAINASSLEDLSCKCTNKDPWEVCGWCDTRDGCSKCDSEWCAPFVGDDD